MVDRLISDVYNDINKERRRMYDNRTDEGEEDRAWVYQ